VRGKNTQARERERKKERVSRRWRRSGARIFQSGIHESEIERINRSHLSCVSLLPGRTDARRGGAHGPEDAALRSSCEPGGSTRAVIAQRARARERERGKNKPDECKMDQPVAGSPRDLRMQRRDRLDEIPMASGRGSTRWR